jgi:uncharacterized membrane protein YbhN (UPF0104 family)
MLVTAVVILLIIVGLSLLAERLLERSFWAFLIVSIVAGGLFIMLVGAIKQVASSRRCHR